MQNIHYVNRSLVDITPYFSAFVAAYETGALCEELADLFTIIFLRGYNPDGTDRMLIDAA